MNFLTIFLNNNNNYNNNNNLNLNNERIFFTIAIVLSHSIPVILYQSFLIFIGYFKLFQDQICQPGKVIDSNLKRRCLINSLVNHLIVYPIGLYVAYPYLPGRLMSNKLEDNNSNNLNDSYTTIILQLILFIFVEDFLFYWSHRALHTSYLYQKFHKQHHEFKVLTGYCFASEFTDPVESILGNVLPVLVGPLICKPSPHLYTICIWIMIRMFKTCDAHSGYKFKFSPFNIPYFPFNSSDRHDFHHETACGSFGSFFCIWDTICGTDIEYITRQKKLLNKKI